MKNTLLNSGLFKTGGSIVALLLVLATGSVLAQDEAIGTILLTKGSVEAVAANGESRVLRRRSEVFAEETVLTGADGFAQIRMVDSAIIALKENTVFRFDEYNFDGEGGAADQAIMNLVQGGFRTVDGLIGSGNSDEYRVDTQYASIGVRGTTHEGVIDPAVDALFTGVWDGGTTVSNGQGAIDLGVGGNFDFSRTDAGDAPQGLLEIPAQLGNIAIAQNPNLDNDDTEEGEGEEEGDDGDDGNDGNDSQDGEAAEQTDGNDGQDDGNNDDGNDETRDVLNDLSEEASNNPSLGSNSNGNAANAPGNAVATAATSSNPSTDSTVTDTEGNSSTNVDVQINPANNARNANALSGNNNAGGNDNNNGNGNNSDDDSPGNSGNAGGGNGNNSDDDSPGNSGNAGGGNGNNSDDGADGGDDSPGNSGNSGGGNGNNSGGGNNADDGTDGSTDGGDDSPGNSGNSGGGNNSDDGTTDGGTDAGDDSPGNSGNSGGGNSGNSGGGNNTDDGTDGSTDGADDSPGNSGNGGGGNSGNSGGGNSNNNGNLSDSGIELDENGCAIVLEVCEEDAEPPADGGDETDGTGNGNSGNGGGGNSNNNAGGNSNNSSSGLQQSSDATVQALVENYASAISGSDQQIAIVDRDDATLLAVTIPADAEGGVDSTGAFENLTVDWGYWTLPGLVSGEEEVSKTEFQRVYLAVVDPANMDDLKSVSGNWQYTSVANQFTGSGTAGTLTGLDMAFDVDLNSGSVSNGSFSAEVAYGAESWTMNFTGSVNGATATMDNFTDASVVTPAGIINGVEGSLGGVFTGAGDSNGFVSGFSLTNGIGSALGGLGLLEGSPQ